ncbi:MAG TPA: alpha/beta hydrolase, partial [Desulfuromonadaceae bacterium]
DHNGKFASEADPNREKRGWGGVSWSSYGDILKALQNREWDQSVNLFYEFPVHAFGYNWTASNGLAGEKLAAYIDQVITGYTDAGRKCPKVLLVTHSMGGLVARSACLLHGAKEKVLGVIHGVQPSNGSPTAYWRMKGGFERPHTTPDIEFSQWFRNPVKMFNHMKGKLVNNELLGIGHITAWILGTDGEEVTALLGNMPGGLQLLPNKQYKNNIGSERWLELLDKEGNKTTLPITDPYKEIYRNDKEYYRLVNPQWLNPGNAANTEDFENNDWKLYTKYLSEAEIFHDALAELNEKVHPETYQFYASGIASPDRVVFTRSEDSLWEKVKRLVTTAKHDAPHDPKGAGKSFVFKAFRGGGNPLLPVLIDTAGFLAGGAVGAVVRDTDWYANRGGYRDRVSAGGQPSEEGELQLVTMQLPDGAGDGTVPESSARALKLPEDTQRTFCIGDLREFEASFVDEKAKRLKPQCKVDFDEGYFDRSHEPIYQTKSAQFITCTAIENICRKEIGRLLQKG